MSDSRQSLVDEKKRIEAALAAIRASKQLRELDVLRQRHTPHDEVSLLKQIGIEARQEGNPLRERLAEINAELSAIKTQPDQSRALDAIVEILSEIRDALQKAEAWR